MDSVEPTQLRYSTTTLGPPRWVWRVMTAWAILRAATSVPSEVFSYFNNHRHFLWLRFNAPHWWQDTFAVNWLFEYFRDVVAFLILISLAFGLRRWAMRSTAMLAVCWCGLRVLGTVYYEIAQRWGELASLLHYPYWQIISVLGMLWGAINPIGVPMTCAMMMRPYPDLGRAWQLLLSIVALTCLLQVSIFLITIISEPVFFHTPRMDVFVDSYPAVFSSLAILFVLLTRRWHWMPPAIMAASVLIPWYSWLAIVRDPSPTIGRMIEIGVEAAIGIGLVATLAWLWHDLNRAVTPPNEIAR